MHTRSARRIRDGVQLGQALARDGLTSRPVIVRWLAINPNALHRLTIGAARRTFARAAVTPAERERAIARMAFVVRMQGAA